MDDKNEIIYVGKAKNLHSRVSSYFVNKASLQPKTAVLVSQIKKIDYILVESEIESLLLEANYIKKYIPKYNIKLADDKNYPLIRITVKNEFPAVLIARTMQDATSVYFGPFPSSTSVKMVLRTMRRIFPYHSVLNHPKKTCLYYHLGLCPCIPAFPNPEEKLNYKKTIKHIVDFLEGNTKKIIKDLESERDEMSKQEKFERAQAIQKQIEAIKYVTHPFHKPAEYVVNPNLREDLREAEMNELVRILRSNNVPITKANRIECYDISNTSGTNPVASMVVFTNGEKDSSQYRKFKMHTKGPNDFAMMQEVLTRRLNHTEWERPDLIIVDGGKGQISSAYEILSGTEIPLVGLAKREETIITPEFVEILLPRRTPALQLVQRLRDEAHRFAITFHRKLRSKNTFE